MKGLAYIKLYKEEDTLVVAVMFEACSVIMNWAQNDQRSEGKRCPRRKMKNWWEQKDSKKS